MARLISGSASAFTSSMGERFSDRPLSSDSARPTSAGTYCGSASTARRKYSTDLRLSSAVRRLWRARPSRYNSWASIVPGWRCAHSSAVSAVSSRCSSSATARDTVSSIWKMSPIGQVEGLRPDVQAGVGRDELHGDAQLVARSAAGCLRARAWRRARPAILRTSMFWPLKANAEVRATTRSVGMCASQFDNSSVSPSHSACFALIDAHVDQRQHHDGGQRSRRRHRPGTACRACARRPPPGRWRRRCCRIPRARRLKGARRSEARRPMTAPVSNGVGTYCEGRVGMPDQWGHRPRCGR